MVILFNLTEFFRAEIFHIILKQGRPPQESERGPYAVVDERCEDTTLDPSMKDLLQRHFKLLFGPLY